MIRREIQKLIADLYRAVETLEESVAKADGKRLHAAHKAKLEDMVLSLKGLEKSLGGGL